MFQYRRNIYLILSKNSEANGYRWWIDGYHGYISYAKDIIRLDVYVEALGYY